MQIVDISGTDFKFLFNMLKEIKDKVKILA